MAQAPPVEAEAAILGPTSVLVRRIEIYESDAITRWDGGAQDNRLIDGSVTIDYSRAERRAIDLTLDNSDFGLEHTPEKFWYDKIMKVYFGVHYVDTTPLVSQTTRTNLCVNPSFETNTTSWAAGPSSTITRDVAVSKVGTSSLKVDTTAANGHANYSVFAPIVGQSVWMGAWVRGTGSVQFECRLQTSGGTTTETVFSDVVTLNTNWQWVSCHIHSANPASVRVWPIIFQRTAGTNTMWIDQVLVENYATWFPTVATGQTFDGTTQAFGNRTYAWSGTAHASTSVETTTILTPQAVKTTWETQVGEFMIDVIEEDHFPFTVKVTGRDYTKKCLLSSFINPTAFAAGSSIETVVQDIAANAGIIKFIMPLTGKTLGKDYYFESGTSRWKAMTDIATGFGYELFFDAQGYLVMREFQDPLTAPLAYILETGTYGNLVKYKKSVNDNRIYNHIQVTGESTDNTVIPVSAEALNTEPSSPTRIDKLGDRVYKYSSPFITTVPQAQDVADKYLRIMSLEEFNLDYSSITLPWLEVGEIIQFNDPRANAGQPDRFLLSSLTLPLGLGAMSGNGKRVSVVG